MLTGKVARDFEYLLEPIKITDVFWAFKREARSVGI
jgi:hypothetical protein